MECGKPWVLVCGSSSVAKIFTCDDTWGQVQGDRDVPVGAMSLAFEKSGENIKYQDHRIGVIGKHHGCAEESEESDGLRLTTNLKPRVRIRGPPSRVQPLIFYSTAVCERRMNSQPRQICCLIILDS